MTDPAPHLEPSEAKSPEVPAPMPPFREAAVSPPVAESASAKARRHVADLGGLYRLSQQLAAESEEAAILEAAAKAARRILGAQAVAIFIRAGTGPQSSIRCAACDGLAEKTALAQHAVVSLQDQGLLAEAVREARTMGVGVRTLAASPQLIAEGWEERSAIVAPLPLPVSDSRVAGAVVWMLDSREAAGLEEVGLAEEIARQTASGLRRARLVAQLASGAIERAKLYEEACRRADELILLNEVGHLLVENPALEGTLRRIAELVCRHFHLAGAGFLLLDESRQALVSSAIFGEHTPEAEGLRIPLGARAITTLALRQNRTLVVENAATDTRLDRTLARVFPGAASGAVIPMAGTSGPAGVFGVWKNVPYVFQPRELQCLGNVARLAAAAVGRGELLQALLASEKRLQEVVDGIHAIIVSIDPQGNVLSFNAAAERMTGRKQAEVLGRSLAAVVSLSTVERARLEKSIMSAFSTQDCSEQLVLNWPSPEGRERKIRWRASFLRSAEGKLTGMVCLGVDITEQTLLEAQLLQAQKMESVGALAGGMAHDFNNLLGGIIGQCAVARSQKPGERMLEALGNIESAAQRGADLTAKLMTFARKAVLRPRAVDFGALIQETVALLSGSFPRAIKIVSKVAPNLPGVHGDPTQLQQVLVNLCVNARDAMPEGGTLTISAQADFAGGSSAEPAGVTVEVADTGTGMTEEVQEHLFEPFFTTKQPGKGTGLGLSVVFGILRSHGGHITWSSAVGKGTCFSFRLPRARPLSGKTEKLVALGGERLPAVSSQPLAASFAGSENLLLVDDDAILRETLRQLLANLGYTVRTAGNGAEALEILDAGAGFVPHAILLDVVMPGLAGLPLFAEFRNRLPGVPVILMSGYSADQTVIGMLEAGAVELVQKPFTIETIGGAIRRCLAAAPAKKAGT